MKEIYESPLCLVRSVSSLHRGEMAITLLSGVYRLRLLPEVVVEPEAPCSETESVGM